MNFSNQPDLQEKERHVNIMSPVTNLIPKFMSKHGEVLKVYVQRWRSLLIITEYLNKNKVECISETHSIPNERDIPIGSRNIS
jgi:hypothetical protein